MTILKNIQILLGITIFFSCNRKNIDYNQNFSNSSTLSYSLLKYSIDTIISRSPEINTHNYVVDLSKGFNLVLLVQIVFFFLSRNIYLLPMKTL